MNNQITAQKFTQKEPDNIVTFDVSSVKSLQIGYHSETIFLHLSEGDSLVLKEYINGLSGSEYYAKVNANRFKTTIRYGRREEVNQNTYVEVFLPASWSGELQLSSQYGHIITEDNWTLERIAVEANEGAVCFQSITAPRIRITTSTGPIQAAHVEGFIDAHTVSGSIALDKVDGGAKLETSSSPILASFGSLNNIIECITLNGSMELSLPENAGMKVDGISKRGDISAKIEGLEVRTKPGNVKNVIGTLGEKPFQNVRLSTINGNISLHY